MRQKGFASVLIIFLVVVLGIGTVGYMAFKNRQIKTSNSQFQKSSSTSDFSPTLLPTASYNNLDKKTANWKIYVDNEHGFSIKYPNDWLLQKGGGVRPWIDVFSPDIGPVGRQEPKIGMSLNITVFDALKSVSDDDLKQLLKTEGILKHFTVDKITEGFISLQNHTMFKYEYQGNQNSYLFHYWGENIENGDMIISILVTDFKEDESLNTDEIANQILASFRFIN